MSWLVAGGPPHVEITKNVLVGTFQPAICPLQICDYVATILAGDHVV